MENEQLKLNNIKALIFDIGDVIHPICWNAPVNELIPLNQSLTTDKYKQALYKTCEYSYILYETGKISPKDFWPFFTARLGIPEIYGGKVKETFHLILGPPNPKILNIINTVKKHRLLFCLTNSCPELERELNNHSYMRWFTRLYFSHKCGVRKPSHDFFWMLLRENRLLPHHCVFIDDKWENIESARNIGFHTVHYASNQNSILQLCRLTDRLP